MKRNFRTVKITAIVLCLLTLTGCWDSADIEKRDILTALIVDKIGNEYYYYAEIANIAGQSTQKDGNQKNNDFKTITAKGKSFAEARDDFNRKSVKSLFLGAGRILMFTDSMSKSGIEEYVNRLRGQIDYRKSIGIATTDSKPDDILKIVPENANSIGFAIESNLDNLAQTGSYFPINIGDVIQIMAVKKVGFLLPDLNIKDNKISLTGYSVFKNNKRIGEIPAENRKGIMCLLSPKFKYYCDIIQSNKKYIVQVISSNKSIKPKFIDNLLQFSINMNFDAVISLTDKIEAISQKDYDEINKQIQEKAKIEIEKAIDASQHEFKCDYLNFYKYFRINYLQEYEKADWYELYSKAKMNVATHVNTVECNIPIKQ